MSFLFALDLVSSVVCQEIGWEERLQNDLFCVELDAKTLIQTHTGLLTSETWHRDTGILSVWSPLVDQEKVKPAADFP